MPDRKRRIWQRLAAAGHRVSRIAGGVLFGVGAFLVWQLIRYGFRADQDSVQQRPRELIGLAIGLSLIATGVALIRLGHRYPHG